jgi:hypothetical protein
MKNIFKVLSVLFFFSCFNYLYAQPDNMYYKDSRPWTRWWWFASEITRESVADNLLWLKNNGFGGAEIAWVYPLNRMQKDTVNYTPRQEWLSPEFSQIVTYAKKFADSLGLGCDFTFGTLWPFGDSKVPFDEATMNMIDGNWRQQITASWEYPKKGFVIDHLNKKALYNYGERVGNSLKQALEGSKSGLFCDSWEVETRYLTTYGFEDTFFKKYGYNLFLYKDSLYSNNEPYKSVRYDYMKLLSEYVIQEFYKPYTKLCNDLGAFSRVQCSGAPCDIISAYSAVDVPESEALLFEPTFSNIVASAASLSGKRIVSAETFTCLYGWPRIHLGEEQTADLKLLVDALFANGVNHIFWHGKPYNTVGTDTTRFYASVHVGSSGSLAEEIPAFNKYMEKVSSVMKEGNIYSDVAVYLPTEDCWIAGELPVEKQFIWAWGEYEQRYTYLPDELKGYRPLWINSEFLNKAEYSEGLLKTGDCEFKALYVDVKYLDIEALKKILELAKKGFPVCLKQIPEEPGFIKSGEKYKSLIDDLLKCGNVKTKWKDIGSVKPFITGNINFDYWCRETSGGLYIFFANPKSRNLSFPLEYGQSYNTEKYSSAIAVQYNQTVYPFHLEFEPYQSLLVKIDNVTKKSGFIDISFIPKTPVVIPRVKSGKELWEVEKPGK